MTVKRQLVLYLMVIAVLAVFLTNLAIPTAAACELLAGVVVAFAVALSVAVRRERGRAKR